ncbi:MAG: hypothetical protein AAF555_10680 [Verrucomicrobiota bacterium]
MKALLLLLASCAFSTGCAVVGSKTPVGQEIVPLEAAKWDGLWVGVQGSAHLRVLDSEGGQMEAWNPQEEEANRFRFEVRSGQGWQFVNLRTDEAEEKWLWAPFVRHDGPDFAELVVYLPNSASFAEFIRTERLPGTIDGESVVLGPLQEAHLAVLTDPKNAWLYRLDGLLVLRRDHPPAATLPEE